MNKNILLNWFINNYRHYVEDMKKSDHGYGDNLQPYHKEGNVWTHTLMVITTIDTLFMTTKRFSNENDLYNTQNRVILLTTALLHDLGKPLSREELESETRGKYYTFKGHEGISTFMSIEVLQKLKIDFPQYFNDEVILKILTLISTHGVAVEDENNEMYFLKETFRFADKNGAVRDNGSVLQEQYPKRKFHKTNKKVEGHELIVLSGLSGSGKSTLIKEKYNDYFIVERDQLLIDLYNENFEPTNSYKVMYDTIKNRGLKEKLDKRFNEYLIEVSKKETKVVIDMTMTSLNSRRKMLNIFSKFYSKNVLFLLDVNELKRRNESRKHLDKNFDFNILMTQMKSFVIPVKEEGFENIEIIHNF